MHELGITENIIEIAQKSAQGAKVKRLTLEIGQLTASNRSGGIKV
jgi:hydrogenase nickel incorporation protein HypA/HybF